MAEFIPQKQFATLDDFIAGQNNFYYHFLEGDQFGDVRRERDYFVNFMKENNELERELTRQTLAANRVKDQMPWEKLYEAYQIMSGMVTKKDIGKYSVPSQFLIS